ncbi:MAG: c-type cytochrome [Campylobacterota bacterium]|nr:c-type cytochrome [Campylobacterota bacterium]
MIKKTFLSVALLATLAYGDETAKELFKAKCSTCHQITRPDDISTLVAPPIMGVMNHVKMEYSTKEEAVTFMVNYVLNPSREKAVCIPRSIKRFGLMPSQKGNVSKEELTKIANYLYDNFPKRGFKHQGMK